MKNTNHSIIISLILAGAVLLIASSDIALADKYSDAQSAVTIGSGAYKTIRNQRNRPEHAGAEIRIMRTRLVPSTYGLSFFQRGGSEDGHGMMCHKAELLDRSDGSGKDTALQCESDASGHRERLTVGHMGSEFCDELERVLAGIGDNDFKTDDGKNPVIDTDTKCRNDTPYTKCVCYRIDYPYAKAKSEKDVKTIGPPGNGSGSGGGNGRSN